MSRSGEEMMLELASLLGTMEKTAAKKDDNGKKDDKKDKKDEEAKEKKDDKEKDDNGNGKKDDKKEKKADLLMNVVSSLVKLATDLDEAGADEASELVDDALRVIVYNIEQANQNQ